MVQAVEGSTNVIRKRIKASKNIRKISSEPLIPWTAMVGTCGNILSSSRPNSSRTMQTITIIELLLSWHKPKLLQKISSLLPCSSVGQIMQYTKK